MIDSTEPGRRADARANRQRLLDVARVSLAADPHASLNSIAKAARVGAGTLYRHFPSREELIVAVNKVEVERFADLAEDFLREHPPFVALHRWCDRLIDHVVRQRGFRETLQAALSLPAQEATYRPVREAIDRLLRASEAAGSIRGGIEAADIQLLLSFIWQIRTEDGERRARRGVGIILRGLQPDEPQPAASRTLDAGQPPRYAVQ